MPAVLIEADGVLDSNLEMVSDRVLVKDGVIVSLSTSPSYATRRRVKGYIAPAFVDAHLHITWLGLALNGADLSPATSPEDVARLLSNARGPVAYGRGWDQERFRDPNTLPTRALLDMAVPDRPAVAVRVCGHLAVANTLALDLTRPWLAYPRHVDRERGMLREDAVYYVVEKLLSLLDTKSLVRDAVNTLASVGVAGASSMSCPANEAKALARLEREGSLPMRVACYPSPEGLEEVAGLLRDSRLVEAVGVKLFADGSLGARTAYLREPYTDDPGSRGVLLLDSERIIEIAGRVLSRGFRVATHAIGDAAIDEVLDAYEELQPGENARIEHASVVHNEQIDRMAGLGVHAVVQPRFRESDWWIDKRLGDRYVLAYRFKTMLGKGVSVALSTDAPVEPYDPRETLSTALGYCNAPACRGEENLGLREAFRAYTYNAAAAAGGSIQELLGDIVPGREARFLLLADLPREGVLPGWRPIFLA